MSKIVFIGNLSWSTTDAQLSEFMGQIGNLVSVSVQRHSDTQRSKGWGLAEFSNHESAMKAVSTLNSTVLNGRQLHLRLDHSNDPKPEGVGLFVGNIPWETTKQEILDLFSSFNPIDCNVATNMMGKSRGFSIVTFKTSEEANLAIAHMNQMEFKGRILECHLDSEEHVKHRDKKERIRVYIGNLSPTITEETINLMFSKSGTTTSVVIKESETADGLKRWGMVKFTDPADAKKAVKLFNGVVATGCTTPLLVRLDRK